MIRKLKHKIFIGILLLAVLLAASGSMFIYQFRLLNHSVDAIIENNYKTIQACQQMLEALEREDSGILLLSLGNATEGRDIITAADSLFKASLAVAANNLTEPNEDALVGAVSMAYRDFKATWSSADTALTQHKLRWYSEQIHPLFLTAKEAVSALMNLNQASMYQQAYALKDQSHRAIMPGIVAIVAVIVFAFLFSFFLSRSLVGPLQTLIAATREFKPNMSVFAPNLKADDEYKELTEGIQVMVSRLNRFHDKAEK